MQQSTKDYPQLTELLSGWFHQDFDIEGETIGEIIDAFNSSCASKQRKRLKKEIIVFLEKKDNVLDEEFNQIFNPDVEPTGFAPTTRIFLEEILLCLSKAD